MLAESFRVQRFPVLAFRSNLDFHALALHFEPVSRLFGIEAERFGLVADFLGLNDAADFGERDAEAKIRTAAKGNKSTLNDEVSWVNENLHRKWSDLSLDVPSEGAINTWIWACENEKEFRNAYHSKPKVVKDEAGMTEELIPESEQLVIERINRLLNAEA